MTYPTSTSGYRLKLQYQYQAGLLRQVKDYNASTVFWQANAMNPRGQITQEQLGNGLVANKAYDAVTGLISSIQCGVNGGACSQNQSYLWDKVGNLIQRQNGNLGLTENFYYDNLHRLDYSQLNGVTNLDMSYDALGNITNRTDVANNAAWQYDAVHKHQVKQAGSGNTYTYDANGNVTARNGNSINWTSYNYPSQITGAGETINLYYDANRQRYKQVYNGNGVTETTLYIGGQLQKVSANGVDDYRYTIVANGQTIAIMSRTSSGNNTTRYVLNDYQGSVAKFTDSSGNSIVSESFTAFGARRNPQTWSGNSTYGDQTAIANIAREGYTGHTALGTLGLNHMNGRVQDAITGRFLSADPYITEPGNTQNYNRYSYVYNNPMSYIDPSGFAWDQLDEVTVTAPSYSSPLYDNPDYSGGGGGNNGGGGGGAVTTVANLSDVNIRYVQFKPFIFHIGMPVMSAAELMMLGGAYLGNGGGEESTPQCVGSPFNDFFVNNFAPASIVATKYNVDLALLLGLSAAESGYGRSTMATSQNNPFGATPGGDSTRGITYNSISSAWQNWGNQWGARVNNVGNNVSQFINNLLQNNQSKAGAIDSRGPYNTQIAPGGDPLWSRKVAGTIRGVQKRLPQWRKSGC